MKLSGVTFRGPALIDTPLFGELPPEYATTLRETNGFVAFDGGFHLRGICEEPRWHSLLAAWRGEGALHRLFPVLDESDVPFAQDCMGDQFVLRDSIVHRLAGETGTLESMSLSWSQFFAGLLADPFEFLQLHPLVQFHRGGGQLRPGQLLSAYPPFVTKESADGVSLTAVSADERIDFLSDFARQLADVAEGEQVRIVVSDDRHT
ncbi:MAG: hypothetical protein QOH88_480 [Verrucomicrobiota bacterium]|jgi:hypothetical protein